MCAVCAILLAGAQTAATYVDAASKKLPKEVSEGLVWQSVTYSPQTKTITFNMTVDPKIVPFQALKGSADMLQQAKVAEILTGSDSDTQSLRNACAKGGNTLQYVFTAGGSESFTMTITPADLK